MANYELIALNESVPQLQAPTSSDTAVIKGNLSVDGTITADGVLLAMSTGPAPGQVPVARVDGKLAPQWIQGGAYKGNAVEMGTATTGILIPDNTQHSFLPQMTKNHPATFIAATPTAEITLYNDGVLGAYVTKDKKVRVNYFGVFESEPVLVNDDYTDIGYIFDDNETDTLSVSFVVDGVQLGSTQVYGFSPTYLRSLLDTEDGFFLLASLGHGTLTNAGTNKLQAPGDAVGLMKDLGADAINFTQATASARPLAGRQPFGGVRNIVRLSETASSVSWAKSKSGTGVTPAPVLSKEKSPDGNAAYQVTLDRGVGNSLSDISQLDTPSISVVSASLYNGGFLVKGVGDSVGKEISFRHSGDGTYIKHTLTDEWYELDNTVTAPTTTNSATLSIANRGTVTNTSSNSVTFIFAETSVEKGAIRNSYQKTIELATDVTEAGVPDVNFLYFDLGDDKHDRTVPAMTGATIVIAGTNGIWIDTIDVAAGTLSFGPTTVTGCPSGLLAVVGKVIGAFCINRALTTPEKEQWIAMFKAMGAPGVFEVSATELVTNGTFDTDVSGWSEGGATLTWESGAARLIINPASFGRMTQEIVVTQGVYILEASVLENSGANAAVRLADNAQGSILYISSSSGVRNVRHVGEVPAGSAFLSIGNSSSAVSSRLVDNISLRKLILNTGA